VSSDGRRHHEQTRIMLRPVGSGLPLGFFSFAIGMLLLGCLSIGWIPVSEQKDVGLLLMAFVFPLELIATASRLRWCCWRRCQRWASLSSRCCCRWRPRG
jgi:succinate-acetate transporter protein